MANVAQGFLTSTTPTPGSTGTVASAVPAQLKSVTFNNFNTTGSKMYLRLYNKATAAASTDTPIANFALLPNTNSTTFAFGDPGDSSTVERFGIACSAGISFRVTAAQGDSDTTAPTAGDCQVTLLYRN